MPCDEEADRPGRFIVPRRTAKASRASDFFRAGRSGADGGPTPREPTRIA